MIRRDLTMERLDDLGRDLRSGECRSEMPLIPLNWDSTGYWRSGRNQSVSSVLRLDYAEMVGVADVTQETAAEIFSPSDDLEILADFLNSRLVEYHSQMP
ncbi:hypothetical protein J6590_077550 [Homalodisca vitripennis]|nr:hypothetical protein J6590_091457 [Homalodisca vitripennis]KAG8290699.1 hypothetical protein J6590_077550 [Homalodisca vitripennis]